MSWSLISVDVFTSTNVVKFSPKLAVEELKMLPNETIGVAVLLKQYEKDFNHSY